ncbi:MAG: IS5/IS1182 family transposase, partial [Lachnospiraceae bacterium]|nr:IS5/IS1182 family transposase [Lachnospiraceae bacterium]
AAIRKQLNYVKRDLIYVDGYVHQNCSLTEKEKELLEVIRKVYDQQKYLYDHKTHTVENRIVSISQPWIRPIVRGKVGTPVEFGAKLGRPTAETKVDKKAEYQDNVDRIEADREFSLEKRCYGLGRIDEKTRGTQLSSIALSVFVANLFKIQRRILFSLFRVRSILFGNICWLSLKWA